MAESDSRSTIGRLFLGSSAINGLSAAANLLATVLIVRLLSPDVYSQFMLDLAVASMLMVAFEVVPSSYSVFRIQDDPAWVGVVSAQLVLNSVLILLLVAGSWVAGKFFYSFSPWIALYGLAMALKRFLDIRLQADGRVVQLFTMDGMSAVLRLVILLLMVYAAVPGTTAVWASLAVSSVAAQCAWLVRERTLLGTMPLAFNAASWRTLLAERGNYPRYYVASAFKRIRDNILPLVAERALPSMSALAAFLLAYRGIAVAMGQVRILEAIFNRRAVLAAAKQFSMRTRAAVALMAQLASILLSALILAASGVGDPPWLEMVVLSLMAWPITLSMAERAEAFATYQASRVTWSILAYVVFLPLAVWCLRLADCANALTLAVMVVLAEFLTWLVIRMKPGREANV